MATRGAALQHILARVRALTLARRRGGKAGAAASLVAVFYLVAVLRQGRRPEVVCRRNGHNVRVLRALAGVIDRPYYPSWLAPNGHVNCLLGFLKRGPRMRKTRELVRAWDGGTFALDWRNRESNQPDLAADAPTLLVIHGLNGNSDEACVLYPMENAHNRGWRAVAMNHRGCGGTRLTSGWAYNGAFTGDVRLAVSHIRHRYPEAPIFAVGYSLGANLLVKYLGEEGKHGYHPLAGAVAVSNPWNFENNSVGGGTPKGFVETLLGKFYSLALTVGLKAALKEHMDNEFLQRRREVDMPGAMRAANLSQYDASMIVPMWGYRDVEEYHRDGSSNRYVADVRCPLLCINSIDDPICQPGLFPLDAARCNPCVIFVATKAGGHIGFGEGFNPWGRQSWADRLIMVYLEALLSERAGLDAATVPSDVGRSDGVTQEGIQSAPAAVARL